MIFIVQFLARVVSILRAAATPSQVASGFCLGMIIAFVPSTIITLLIIVLLIIFNVNIASALLSIVVFTPFAYLLDPVLHSLGYFILVDIKPLRDLWTMLYNTPFIPFTGFNNTVVMGGLAFSLVFFIPVFIGAKKGIVIYRNRYDDKVKQWKIIRYLRASLAYQWYVYLRGLGDRLW